MNKIDLIYKKKLNKKIKLKNKFYLKLIKSHSFDKEILRIRNNNKNLNFTLTKNKIFLADHRRWFQNFLKKKNFIFIILYLDKIIGYIRLEKNRKNLIISIIIKKKFRKNNLGSISLEFIEKKFEGFNLVAYVSKDNLLSINFFKKNKFKKFSKKKKLFII